MRKEEEMTNLEYLEKVKLAKGPWLEQFTRNRDLDAYRQAKALEIIAEQIINLDNTLAVVVASLENIENVIRQGN